MPKKAPAATFYTEPFLKWRQSMLQFRKKALIFAKRQQRSLYCLLNFKRSDLKCTKSSHFLEYLRYRIEPHFHHQQLIPRIEACMSVICQHIIFTFTASMSHQYHIAHREALLMYLCITVHHIYILTCCVAHTLCAVRAMEPSAEQ